MNPQLKVVAERQGGVFARRQAISSGYTPGQIRRRLADGRWVRIRHGQYCESLDLSALPPWEQQTHVHRRLVHAVMNSWRSGAIAVSHQSALALHGAPLWGRELGQVHVTRLDELAGGLLAGVRHHVGRLAEIDLTEVDGLMTTTVARAIVESACTASFEATVVSVDAALRDHAMDENDVRRLLGLIEFWPGSATARAAVSFGDARSESVGESRLRVLMHNHGLPVPVLQVEFRDSDGLIGRVDFYFPQYRTVVEFDGRIKYGGGSPEVLVQEKIREDRLRALGLQVVRSVWSDFDRPHRLVAGIRQAFDRAQRAA
ncbi:type IV toxin-antitoxin system AbiEi family antitoxin domain-containing protein [Kribbella sp. NPDC050124]|uniref:type IV toxin-antitoxin system AbiEi family antitoxin domain-containing protein n=1 Tax=Kribbella sp. NPDC050124 TaxID=3364114 RepID=UPI00378C156E